MSVLTWKHGRSKDQAIAMIKAALKDSGHDEKVTWSGQKLEARFGPFAAILHVTAEVTADAVVLKQCSGLAGGVVLSRCRESLRQIFPDGEPA